MMRKSIVSALLVGLVGVASAAVADPAGFNVFNATSVPITVNVKSAPIKYPDVQSNSYGTQPIKATWDMVKLICIGQLDSCPADIIYKGQTQTIHLDVNTQTVPDLALLGNIGLVGTIVNPDPASTPIANSFVVRVVAQ